MSFLRDRDGHLSMGRIGALLVLIMAIVWNVLSMIRYEPLPDGTIANLTALLGIFAGWVGGTKFTKADVPKEE